MIHADGTIRQLFPSKLIVLVLASAIAIPVAAQQAGDSQSTQPTVTQQPTSQQQSPSASATKRAPEKEGFWGHMNPFARKKWVNKRIDPLKDQLSELDEVTAKNANDIKDVDGRAQAGIHKAQSTADSANQAATAAGDQAQKASATALGANTHVNQLGETVGGLDLYRPISETDVTFRNGQPILSAAARKQLDDLAAGLAGHKGYIVEIEGHSRAAGNVGIQNSNRLNEAVKRYLVTEHQIPVYRLHAVALGNAKAVNTANGSNAAAAQNGKAAPIRTSSVHIRLMENSLAAQGTASPHDATPLNGAERP